MLPDSRVVRVVPGSLWGGSFATYDLLRSLRLSGLGLEPSRPTRPSVFLDRRHFHMQDLATA